MNKIKSVYNLYKTHEDLIWGFKGLLWDGHYVKEARKVPGQVKDVARKATLFNAARIISTTGTTLSAAASIIGNGSKLLELAKPGLMATSLTSLKLHPGLKMIGKAASIFVNATRLHKSRMLLQSLAKVKEERAEFSQWVSDHESDLIVALGQDKYETILGATQDGIVDVKTIIEKVEKDLREQRLDSTLGLGIALVDFIVALLTWCLGDQYKDFYDKIGYISSVLNGVQFITDKRRAKLEFKDEKEEPKEHVQINEKTVDDLKRELPEPPSHPICIFKSVPLPAQVQAPDQLSVW